MGVWAAAAAKTDAHHADDLPAAWKQAAVLPEQAEGASRYVAEKSRTAAHKRTLGVLPH